MNLGELYQRYEDAKEAGDAASEAIYRLEGDQEAKEDVEISLTNSQLLFEKQGFINGFRLGLCLAMEALVK